MKENSTHKTLSKRKKLLMILTPVCSLVVAGAVVTTVLVTAHNKKINELNTEIDNPVDGDDDPVDVGTDPDDGPVGGAADDNPVDSQPDDEGDAPVSGTITVFADPVKNMNILHTFGFYYNSTLNCYYEHRGVDVAAEAGDEVYATTDGTITAIYSDDVLLGNQVVLTGGEGIVTVYDFIDPLETLSVGDKIKKGEIIGTVSAANGSEYKDGAHVHVEVYVNGSVVDPENYLSSTEK